MGSSVVEYISEEPEGKHGLNVDHAIPLHPLIQAILRVEWDETIC